MKGSRPTKAKEPPTLERKIYFFRSSVGKDAAGINIPFGIVTALAACWRFEWGEAEGHDKNQLDASKNLAKWSSF